VAARAAWRLIARCIDFQLSNSTQVYSLHMSLANLHTSVRYMSRHLAIHVEARQQKPRFGQDVWHVSAFACHLPPFTLGRRSLGLLRSCTLHLCLHFPW